MQHGVKMIGDAGRMMVDLVAGPKAGPRARARARRMIAIGAMVAGIIWLGDTFGYGVMAITGPWTAENTQ